LPWVYPNGIDAFADLQNESINHQYLDWLADKKSYLELAMYPAMPRGFIHGDIFWDNLLFEDGALVAILDFEEACHFYSLFDTGMAGVGCCSDNGHFNISLLKALLGSYAAISPFTSSEKSQLNIFVEYAAVAASFWRFRQYNVKYPNRQKADSYKALSSLADQIHTLGSTSLLD
jgi:homoserine kinase type II